MNYRILLLSLMIPTAAAAESDVPRVFRAGSAASNITPPLGTLRVGSFAPYPTVHVHDELHARCLVLSDGKTTLALVVCDLLGLHRSISIEARRLIQEATGIPPENVMISATHTHSAGARSARAAIPTSRNLTTTSGSWPSGLPTGYGARRTCCDPRKSPSGRSKRGRISSAGAGTCGKARKERTISAG